MNFEEFSFANQQLAGMLRAGIPLEGALARISSELKEQKWRQEFQALEADLKQGIPLKDAISRRGFPELYRHLFLVGIKGNDLPAVLVLLADHFRQKSLIEIRLKGLMFYPAIFLVSAFLLSLFMALFHFRFFQSLNSSPEMFAHGSNQVVTLLALWTPPLILGCLILGLLLIWFLPPLRNRWRSRMPGWREAHLTQTAASFELLLSRGCSLGDATKLLAGAENQSWLGRDLQQWQQAMSGGAAKFLTVAAGSRSFPGLFIYLVSAAGENIAAGFSQAAEVYRARANYRINLFLWAFLPVSVLVLGVLIVSQAIPFLSIMIRSMDQLGDMGGASSRDPRRLQEWDADRGS